MHSSARFFAVTVLWLAMAGTAPAQDNGWRPASPQERTDRYGGQNPNSSADAAAGDTRVDPFSQQTAGAASTAVPGGSGDLTPIGSRPQRARVTEKTPTLPRDQGQVFREYDIRPYTLRVTGAGRPEQAIVDWILRETGYEAWHTEPVGLLTAGRESMSVHHIPEMQAIVAEIVDRFVNAQADGSAFSLRIATVGNPNWRAKALPLMAPIPVQSPGVQGWLLAKEDSALLISELTRRTDYREYNSAGQLISNGQSVLVSTMRPRPYIKGIVPTAQAWPGYQPEMGQLEEGFALEFSPLLSLDLTSADAIVKLRLHQVEKMLPVKLDLPTVVTPNQRVQVEVPQMTTANLHERFRWPTDKVLLLSMGVVATPDPKAGNPLTDAVPLLKSAPRADALLFVECKTNLVPAAEPTAIRSAILPQQTFQGRY
jgi:hypothetical protein